MKLPAEEFVVKALSAREIPRTESDLGNTVKAHCFSAELPTRLRIRSVPASADFIITLMREIPLHNSVGCLLGILQIRAIARPRLTVLVRRLADINEKACAVRSGQGFDSLVEVETAPGTHFRERE